MMETVNSANIFPLAYQDIGERHVPYGEKNCRRW